MNITVGTTPVLLLPKNINRQNVILQNTGNEDIYIKKWLFGNPIAPIPSPTNYDLVLRGKPGEGNKEDEPFQTASVSAYIGVTAKNTTTIGAWETVKIGV